MGSVKNSTDQSKCLKRRFWTQIDVLAETTYKLPPKTHELEQVWTRLMNSPRNQGIAAFWKNTVDFDFEWLQHLETYKV